MKQEENRLNYGLISKYRPVLMGVAILLILFCHLQNVQNAHDLPHTRLAGLLQIGTVGVDIFLLLSGVGLYYSYTKNPMPYRSFELKRLRRILPYYLILAGATYLIDDVFIRHLGFGKFFRDLFFVSWFLDGSTRYWYVLAIIVFYLLFPALCPLVRGKNRSFFPILLIGLVWWSVTEILCQTVDAITPFRIALERLPIFLFGVYAGKLSMEKREVKKAALIVFVVLGFLLLILQKRVLPSAWRWNLHYPIRAALSVSVVASVILIMELLEKRAPRISRSCACVLAWFGGLTYELYLLHQSYMIVLDSPGTLGGYVLAGFVLPAITSAGIYWGRKALKKRRAHESIQHL